MKEEGGEEKAKPRRSVLDSNISKTTFPSFYLH